MLFSELSSFRYMETKEGIAEIPLHCLEFEDVSSATSNQDKKLEVVLSSLKSAKETLEKDTPPSWGHIVHVTEKHDRFSVSYRPSSCLPDPKSQKKFYLVKSNNIGFQSNNIVAVIDGASSRRREVPNFACKCPTGFKIDSWTAYVYHNLFC